MCRILNIYIYNTYYFCYIQVKKSKTILEFTFWGVLRFYAPRYE